MKKVKYLAMALLAGSTLFGSCDSMEDTYTGYYENGEIVYRAKAKKLVAFSGYKRAKLEWILAYPTQVVRCEIHNGKELLATLPVTYQDSLKLEYTLDNLDEKSYTFSVYSFDKDGNSSVKSDVIVNVYGDNYVSTLRTERAIEEVLRKADQPATVQIKLAPIVSAKLVKTELSYKSVGGTAKTVVVLPGQNEVQLTDVASDSDYKLQDAWKPEATAIDDFKAAQRVYAADKLPVGSARTFGIAYKTDPTTVYVTLSTASANVLRSVITYGSKTVTVERGTNAVSLTEVPAGAVISMTTVLSTTAGEYQTPGQKQATASLLTKVAMTGWEVIDFSSQQQTGEGAAGGHAAHAIDNDLATFWHTQYSPGQPVYPHFMTVDMKSSCLVKGVAVSRRNGNNNTAGKMRLEVSTNGTSWTNAGDFSPNNSIDGLQLFQLSNPTEGRYFKLTGLSSATSATYMCISEVNIYK